MPEIIWQAELFRMGLAINLEKGQEKPTDKHSTIFPQTFHDTAHFTHLRKGRRGEPLSPITERKITF